MLLLYFQVCLVNLPGHSWNDWHSLTPFFIDYQFINECRTTRHTLQFCHTAIEPLCHQNKVEIKISLQVEIYYININAMEVGMSLDVHYWKYHWCILLLGLLCDKQWLQSELSWSPTNILSLLMIQIRKAETYALMSLWHRHKVHFDLFLILTTLWCLA